MPSTRRCSASWLALRCATARDCRLARVLIRDVMTESVVTAAPERTVREIAELMRERNVGSVVLVNGTEPVGFVTDRDLALSVIADGRDFGDHVADHASSPVITAEASMDVEEAGELMVRHAIRRLVVVDGGRLTGIVTLDDLASRTGDAELASQLAGRVTRAVMPDFFFHERGDR
jgi:CBS domain-containing protein